MQNVRAPFRACLLHLGAADFALVRFLAYHAKQSHKGSSEGGIAAGVNNRADCTIRIPHPARNLFENNTNKKSEKLELKNPVPCKHPSCSRGPWK